MLFALKHFGFNDSFLYCVNTMYIDTCVINNGWIAEMFKNTRGFRQAFSLSAFLFVLSVEITVLRIRMIKIEKGLSLINSSVYVISRNHGTENSNNKNRKEFQVKIDEINHNIKISQLACNTTLFITQN